MKTHLTIIRARLTSQLQPLDVSINNEALLPSIYLGCHKISVANFIRQNFIVFKFSKTLKKTSKTVRIPRIGAYFSLALVVVEL